MCLPTKRALRKQKGSMIADVPAALWVLLVLFTFPLIDLAAITIRYTFLVTASRDAAHAAAQAKSFFTSVSGQYPSAVILAEQQANTSAQGFSEISINNVKTNIVTTNINSGAVSRRSTPLTAAADTSTNLYQIEVEITGQINPLITNHSGSLLNIPGISSPMQVVVASREYCEFPQGLTQ
jgi:hypothetical protein